MGDGVEVVLMPFKGLRIVELHRVSRRVVIQREKIIREYRIKFALQKSDFESLPSTSALKYNFRGNASRNCQREPKVREKHTPYLQNYT